MTFDQEQRGILRGSLLALGFGAAIVGGGYAWLPAEAFGLHAAGGAGDRIAFALKADLPIFIWLAGCVRAVSSVRFRSAEDRAGSAFAPPSPRLRVRAAVLQNSLEQTVLAVGAHLILATVLRGAELVVLPLLVLLYLCGRAAFAVGYAKGASARAFGMALTAAPSVGGYVAAAALMIGGR